MKDNMRIAGCKDKEGKENVSLKESEAYGVQGSTYMYGPAKKGGGGQNQKGKTKCSSLSHIIRNVTLHYYYFFLMAINNNGDSESYAAAMDY